MALTRKKKFKKSSRSMPWVGSKAFMSELEEMKERTKIIKAFVRRAQYRKSFLAAEEAYRVFPGNRIAIYNYAVALGDCDEWAKGSVRRSNVRKSVFLLRKLLSRARGVDPRWVSSWRNEYFWFSNQPYKQWSLGLADSKKREGAGYYSMGVGAVMISVGYYKRGKPILARNWAKKAVFAWQKYFKVVPNYYNAFCWYARAQGLGGDLDGMTRSFEKAAKLSGRSLNYVEFVEARKDVLQALAPYQESL